MSLEKPKIIHKCDGYLEISLTYKVNECSNCPYSSSYAEQGWSSTFCEYPGVEKFTIIPNHGFREDCPLLKGK